MAIARMKLSASIAGNEQGRQSKIIVSQRTKGYIGNERSKAEAQTLWAAHRYC